jgi:hypothetical protein
MINSNEDSSQAEKIKYSIIAKNMGSVPVLSPKGYV